MSNEQEHWEIYPSLGCLSARRNPVTGLYDVTLSGTAWTNLLSIIGYARACAALSHEGLMEQGADEMMAALRQAETKDE